MEKDKFWKVEMYGIIEYEYSDDQCYYFLTEKEASKCLEKLKRTYIREDGSYLPSYNYIEFNMKEISYEELKEEITANEFEELFGIDISLEAIKKGNIMIKEIIETNENLKNTEVIALCKWKGNLVAVPCDNAMSGYYPRYREAIIIKENVEDLYGEIEALLLVKYWGKYEIIFATDSHDGFQPASVENVNDFVEFIKWIAMYI